MTIEQYYNNAKQIDLREVVSETIEEQREDVIELNQYQLYLHSQDSDNEKLQPYKSLTYSLYKNEKNPNVGFGNADLYDTGSFYKNMYLTVSKDYFEVDSKDSKSSELKKKYGNKIFGLSDDSLAIYTKDYFTKLFFHKINELLK